MHQDEEPENVDFYIGEIVDDKAVQTGSTVVQSCECGCGSADEPRIQFLEDKIEALFERAEVHHVEVQTEVVLDDAVGHLDNLEGLRPTVAAVAVQTEASFANTVIVHELVQLLDSVTQMAAATMLGVVQERLAHLEACQHESGPCLKETGTRMPPPLSFRPFSLIPVFPDSFSDL